MTTRTFREMGGWRSYIPAALFLALVVAACFYAYWPSYAGEFLLDDYKHLETTRPILFSPFKLFHVLSPYFNGWYYRPTNYLFFTLMQAVFGYRPPAYYFTLLLIHTLNLFLVFGLARRLGAGRLAALCAAALFAITLPNQDVFGWISSVSVVLAATFALLAILSLLIYLQGGREKGWLLLTTAVSYLLALLSNEVALILLPLLALLLIQDGVWRSLRPSELLAAAGMSGLTFVYAVVTLTRPTWTARSDVLGAIASVRFLAPSELSAFIVDYLSLYLFFDPAVVLQYQLLSLLLLLLLAAGAVLLFWKGNALTRLGVTWWALGAVFLYLFLWLNGLVLGGRHYYLPWIGVALIFAAALSRLHLDAASGVQKALFLMGLAVFLLLQAAYARAAQHPWQQLVNMAADNKVQIKALLPDLDASNALYANELPPADDYIAAMASVWYERHGIYGGQLQRLLTLGQATDSTIVLDYKDGRVYNLMPELQDSPLTTFLWDAAPQTTVLHEDGSRQELEQNAYQPDIVSGPPGQNRFGFFLHPPLPADGSASLTIPAQVPQDSALVFSLWKQWGGIEDEDGVLVSVTISMHESDEQLLYQVDLSSPNDEWTDVAIPMATYGDQQAQISFLVSAGENTLHDHLYVANPRFVPISSTSGE